MVDDEIRLASGDKIDEEKKDNEPSGTSVSSLVTSDGTYASQSIFSSTVWVSSNVIPKSKLSFTFHVILTFSVRRKRTKPGRRCDSTLWMAISLLVPPLVLLWQNWL